MYSVPANPRALRGRGRSGRHNNNADYAKPHAEINARTRRLWQVGQGQLTGSTKNRLGSVTPFVHEDAHYAAHGLVSPRGRL